MNGLNGNMLIYAVNSTLMSVSTNPGMARNMAVGLLEEAQQWFSSLQSQPEEAIDGFVLGPKLGWENHVGSSVGTSPGS